MVNLLGKRVLITGASSGIGADLARELAAQGAELVLAARRRPELEALAAELAPARATVIQADLSSRAGVDALIEAAGRVDVLVNNAGIDVIGKPWDPGIADQGELLMQVNVLAPMRLTARLVGPMVERGQGCIVFVSSVAGWTPLPSAAWYSASKAALARYAETVRIDLKGTGVDVVAVYPGPVHTPMLARALEHGPTNKQFRFLPKGTSTECARRVADAITHGHDTVFYPSVLRVAAWLMGLSRIVVGAQAPAYERKPGG